MDWETTWGSAQEEGVLRSCLNDISASSELLGRLVEGERERECLGVLNRGTVRLLRLLQHRELARRLSGDVPPPEGLVELGGLCRRLCEQSEPLLARAEVELLLQLPEQEARVLGDEELLEHLLLMLLSNGAKASGAGGAVCLSLRVEGDYARLSLGDGGRGLDLRALDLQRGEEDLLPDLNPVAGAGRGLALARRIAALHGGGLIVKLDPRRSGGVVLSLPLSAEKGELNRGRSYLPESGYERALVELSELLPAGLFGPGPV